MLKTLALILGIATALLANSILASANAAAVAGTPEINRTIKEDRQALLVLLPNTPAKQDRVTK